MPHDFDQSRRYIRQTIFAPIGKSGQDQIGAAKIAVVGCGALGSAIADQLARAGVGSLRLIDRDFRRNPQPAASIALHRSRRA